MSHSIARYRAIIKHEFRSQYPLLPFHCADGFGREVVADAADAGNLGGNAGGDALEQRPVELGHRRRS